MFVARMPVYTLAIACCKKRHILQYFCYSHQFYVNLYMQAVPACG